LYIFGYNKIILFKQKQKWNNREEKKFFICIFFSFFFTQNEYRPHFEAEIWKSILIFELNI